MAGSVKGGSAAALVHAERKARAIFMQELERSSSEDWARAVDGMCDTVDASGVDGIYHNWTEALGDLEEWKDDRPIGRLGAKGFFVKNVPYASGLEINRRDIEHDRLGLYANRIKDLAYKAKFKWYLLMKDLFVNGFTSTGYDGVSFFNDSHPDGNDNLLTTAFGEAGLNSAYDLFLAMLDDKSNNLHVMPTHVIVGRDNYRAALNLLKLKVLTSDIADTDAATTNRWLGQLDVILLPEMTTKWGLACLNKRIKPFIKQVEKEPTLTSITSDDSVSVFMRDKYLFGVDMAGAMAYGHHQVIVGSTGAG